MSLNEIYSNFLFIALLLVSATFLGIPGAIYSLQASSKRAGFNRFPPAICVALDQNEAMDMVHDLLLQADFVGCNWQINDEDSVNSCIRAVLAGTPPGAGQRIVEILIYVFLGNLGLAQTRVEWSFIVNCGTDEDVNLILRKTNLVFEKAFLQKKLIVSQSPGQLAITNSLARQVKLALALVAEAEESESAGPLQAEVEFVSLAEPVPMPVQEPIPSPVPTPMPTPGPLPGTADSAKSCPTCNYHLDAAFSFCLHCGA